MPFFKGHFLSVCLVSLIKLCVCEFLTNFMPALVPPPENLKDEDVDIVIIILWRPKILV